MTTKINKVNIALDTCMPMSPPKSALDLTIQERRENLSCYSSKSGIWKSLVKMNMKKQYSRHKLCRMIQH